MKVDLMGVGQRIRKQREFLGYSREQLAEMLDVTPKFCSDIELGLKGMSVSTLCNISHILKLSTDYILFGNLTPRDLDQIILMLQMCPSEKLPFAVEILKNFILSLDS